MADDTCIACCLFAGIAGAWDILPSQLVDTTNFASSAEPEMVDGGVVWTSQNA